MKGFSVLSVGVLRNLTVKYFSHNVLRQSFDLRYINLGKFANWIVYATYSSSSLLQGLGEMPASFPLFSPIFYSGVYHLFGILVCICILLFCCPFLSDVVSNSL